MRASGVGPGAGGHCVSGAMTGKATGCTQVPWVHMYMCVYLLGYKHSLTPGPGVRELQQPQIHQGTRFGQLQTHCPCLEFA